MTGLLYLKNISTLINTILKDNDKGIVVGIGVPSFVFENGIVDSTYSFLEFMEDYPLVQFILEMCGLKCKINNDARMGALGEALYGNAKITIGYWY